MFLSLFDKFKFIAFILSHRTRNHKPAKVYGFAFSYDVISNSLVHIVAQEIIFLMDA